MILQCNNGNESSKQDENNRNLVQLFCFSNCYRPVSILYSTKYVENASCATSFHDVRRVRVESFLRIGGCASFGFFFSLLLVYHRAFSEALAQERQRDRDRER